MSHYCELRCHHVAEDGRHINLHGLKTESHKKCQGVFYVKMCVCTRARCVCAMCVPRRCGWRDGRGCDCTTRTCLPARCWAHFLSDTHTHACARHNDSRYGAHTPLKYPLPLPRVLTRPALHTADANAPTAHLVWFAQCCSGFTGKSLKCACMRAEGKGHDRCVGIHADGCCGTREPVCCRTLYPYRFPRVLVAKE